MIEKYIETIESAIESLGVKASEIRGEENGQWQIFRGPICLFIDVWTPVHNTDWNYTVEQSNNTTFQVIAPITKLPENEKLFSFYEELLHMNMHIYKASLIININDRVLAVKFKQLVDGLTEKEVIDALECVGYYAEMLTEYFVKKYNVKKISE
ncbi:MAG: hypothetical protein HUU47_03130 [Bacteroidetes bacterium]|nr:hypothetical protein [Bacteroidota bacterium]